MTGTQRRNLNADVALSGSSGSFARGMKQYFLSNHLGNTLAIISDKRFAGTTKGGVITSYVPDIVSATDYSSFGVSLLGRQINISNVEYGFNGKWNEIETGYQNYGMRDYDAKARRFSSVDPIAKSFPWNTPYAFSENDVIRSIDLDGLEKLIIDQMHDKFGRQTRTVIIGMRDRDTKTAIEMDMMSKLGIRLAKQDVYLIRRRQDNSISFEGNAGGLTPTMVKQISNSPEKEATADAALPPNTMRESMATSRGNFYKSQLKDWTQNEFFEDQFNLKNSTPIKSGNLTVISNTSFSTGTFNSNLNGTASDAISPNTFSTVSGAIIDQGKNFLVNNNLNVGFVETITLTIPNKNLKGWGKLRSDLATRFNIPANNVKIKFDPNITAKDSGLPVNSIVPTDGSLHVDVIYSGVKNGSKDNEIRGAINR